MNQQEYFNKIKIEDFAINFLKSIFLESEFNLAMFDFFDPAPQFPRIGKREGIASK